MPLEEDLTVLIDYELYHERVQPQRVQRQVAKSNHSQPLYQQSQQKRTQNFRHRSSEECDHDGITNKISTTQQYIETKIDFNINRM